MRLLPKDEDQGWTPYAWLTYAIPFAIWPAFRNADLQVWAINTFGLLIFLALYFRAFWMMGPRLVWISAALTALGLVYTPINPSAVAFFTYAGVFLGWTGKTRTVCWGTALIAATITIEGLLAPVHTNVWVSGILFSVLFAFVMLHFSQREKVNAKLRLAQEEVEHLARVAERERIARDLHDLLGHTLSVIVLKSELAAKLAEREPALAAAEIRDVESVARDALTQVRTAVRGYRSIGLKTEFVRAESVLRDAGLEVESNYHPVQLAPLAESVLTLVLREAVTNIIRHAKASRCVLKAGVAGSAFEMQVTDNGVGAHEPEGVGLTGMRERVQSLGGALERTVEGGTSILIRLPREHVQGVA